MNFDDTMTLCDEHVERVILPALDLLEDIVIHVADDIDECASPHYTTFVAMVYELVARGWTPEELTDQIKTHGPEAQRVGDDVKKGLN